MSAADIDKINAQAAAARLRDAAAGVPAPSAAKSNGATPPNDGIQATPPKQMRREHASAEEWAKSARDAIADPAARKVVRDTILAMQAEGELAKRDALFRGAIALEQFNDRGAEDLLAEAACERLRPFFDVPGADDPEASVHEAVTDTIGRGLFEARERRSKRDEERSRGTHRQDGDRKAHTDSHDRKRDQERKLSAWRENMIDPQTLCEQRFPEVKYVVPGIFPEGVILLASRPKLGKSWLILQTSAAVATGRGTLVAGENPGQGDVPSGGAQDTPPPPQPRPPKYFRGPPQKHATTP